MKHISVLIPEGDTSLSNVEAAYKMFAKVNEALVRRGEEPRFEVQLVGLRKNMKLHSGLATIHINTGIHDVVRTDVIIIPAVHGNMEDILSLNRDLLPWIEQQYRRGAEVASLCIGAFILAATGLLNGRSCTTHWLAADDFGRMFPAVSLQAYKIITDEAGIYTSGGAYSALNLILYLVEKYAGREMALQASKIFEIDIERFSQSPFIVFRGQKDHEDEPIRMAQDFIERNFNEKISIDQLSSMLALGRRNLERRFKKATGNTVTEYLQRVKIEAAKKGFETSSKNISEIMYEVGYTDVKAFRAAFRKITGLSPAAYRRKYNKEEAAVI